MCIRNIPKNVFQSLTKLKNLDCGRFSSDKEGGSFNYPNNLQFLCAPKALNDSELIQLQNLNRIIIPSGCSVTPKGIKSLKKLEELYIYQSQLNDEMINFLLGPYCLDNKIKISVCLCGDLNDSDKLKLNSCSCCKRKLILCDNCDKKIAFRNCSSCKKQVCCENHECSSICKKCEKIVCSTCCKQVIERNRFICSECTIPPERCSMCNSPLDVKDPSLEELIMGIKCTCGNKQILKKTTNYHHLLEYEMKKREKEFIQEEKEVKRFIERANMTSECIKEAEKQLSSFERK